MIFAPVRLIVLTALMVPPTDSDAELSVIVADVPPFSTPLRPIRMSYFSPSFNW